MRLTGAAPSGLVRLFVAAENREDGSAWLTTPDRLIPMRRSQYPDGNFNLGLAHGVPGIVGALFQATGDELFREAALYWLRRTLELRRPGEGVGGFLARGPDRAGQEAWLADPGFLTGAAGVGLALLSAAMHVEPRWDRLLLCSTREDLI